MAEWTCPRCGRVFQARDARHSCVSQDPEKLLAPWPDAIPLCRAVRDLLAGFGPVEPEATRTQVSFRARRRFAYLWVPRLSLNRGSDDLHLTFDLRRREASPRVKESVESRPGLWTHHVLLRSASDLDEEVAGWLREAYLAGSAPPRPRKAPAAEKARKAPARKGAGGRAR